MNELNQIRIAKLAKLADEKTRHEHELAEIAKADRANKVEFIRKFVMERYADFMELVKAYAKTLPSNMAYEDLVRLNPYYIKVPVPTKSWPNGFVKLDEGIIGYADGHNCGSDNIQGVKLVNGVPAYCAIYPSGCSKAVKVYDFSEIEHVDELAEGITKFEEKLTQLIDNA